MFQIKKINGHELLLNQNFLTFFKKDCFGVNTFSLDKFKQRFEIDTKINYSSNFFYEKFKFVLYKYLSFSFPDELLLKNKFLTAILFLNLINIYKGWRHLKGLPCRGQRTWTNAWTSYKKNNILREHKKLTTKKFYGKIGGPEQRIATLCEYINFFWKTQWFSEWLYSRIVLKNFYNKNKDMFSIDLTATAKGYLGNLRKDNPKLGKKKKKLLTGAIGFDQGFTKYYLKKKYELSKKNRKKSKKNRKKYFN